VLRLLERCLSPVIPGTAKRHWQTAFPWFGSTGMATPMNMAFAITSLPDYTISRVFPQFWCRRQREWFASMPAGTLWLMVLHPGRREKDSRALTSRWLQSLVSEARVLILNTGKMIP
jgi:hypothetical protein